MTLKEDRSPHNFLFFFYGQAEELKASLPSGELDVRDSNCADEWNKIFQILRDNSSETQLPLQKIIQNTAFSLFEKETQN